MTGPDIVMFVCAELISVATGALVAYFSLLPLLRLRKQYRPKRIVLASWEPFVALGLVALMWPLATYLEEQDFFSPIGPQPLMLGLAALICWFYAQRFLARFVIRAPLQRLVFQAVVMPGVLGTSVLVSGLMLTPCLDMVHLLASGYKYGADWLLAVPLVTMPFAYLLTRWVARAVAPPDHPDEADKGAWVSLKPGRDEVPPQDTSE